MATTPDFCVGAFAILAAMVLGFLLLKGLQVVLSATDKSDPEQMFPSTPKQPGRQFTEQELLDPTFPDPRLDRKTFRRKMHERQQAALRTQQQQEALRQFGEAAKESAKKYKRSKK